MAKTPELDVGMIIAIGTGKSRQLLRVIAVSALDKNGRMRTRAKPRRKNKRNG